MVAEVIVGRPDLGNAAWIGITAVIVVAAYGVAVAVPNIWPVMVRSSPVVSQPPVQSCTYMVDCTEQSLVPYWLLFYLFTAI